MTITEQAATEQAEGGAGPLHLPDLHIEGFRGIDLLTVPRLGRVTLIAGKNGIGKTTVLDAVRAYAAAGDPTYLAGTLLNRQEVSVEFNPIDGVPLPNWQALFNGRKASRVSICASGSSVLQIEEHILSNAETKKVNERLPNQMFPVPALALTFGEVREIRPLIPMRDPLGTITYPMRLNDDAPALSENRIECLFIQPGIAAPESTASLWDIAARTGEEKNAAATVKKVLGQEIDDIIMMGEGPGSGRRIAMVKTSLYQERVPLQSFGQGTVRLYQIALGLAYSKNGFLLIDEAENGLHYSVQRDFWRMVLQTAQANNVQVLATTHSADCVRGFAEAVNEDEGVEGVYLRLERDAEGVYTVDYPKDDLLNAARNRTEMR